MFNTVSSIDDEGYERCTRTWTDGECDCGQPLEWIQDTEEWTEKKHSDYGAPYTGCSCGLIYHGNLDGSMAVFRLEK